MDLGSVWLTPSQMSLSERPFSESSAWRNGALLTPRPASERCRVHWPRATLSGQQRLPEGHLYHTCHAHHSTHHAGQAGMDHGDADMPVTKREPGCLWSLAPDEAVSEVIYDREAGLRATNRMHLVPKGRGETGLTTARLLGIEGQVPGTGSNPCPGLSGLVAGVWHSRDIQL